MAISFNAGVEDAIAQDLAHLGANEKPAGSNKTAFGQAFGLDPAYYCATARYTCTCIWGKSSAAMVKSASSSAIQDWHRGVGRSVAKKDIQRGDLIHVYKNGVSVHIERFLGWGKNGEFICVGSNTSNTSGGSTANGGGSYKNNRRKWYDNWGSNKGWAIKGASRPLYGVTVDDVLAIQRADGGVKADGKYGTATKAATIRVQKRLGVKADGFPGPKTVQALLGGTVTPDLPKPAAPSLPSVPAPAGKLAENGQYDTATHTKVQIRMGRPQDGRLGLGDLHALYQFFDLPVDDEISDQVRTAAQIGNAINPKIWDHDPDHKGNASKLVRCLEAYVGVTVDRGIWGPDLSRGIQRFINTFDAGFTAADRGIALARKKAAGV